MSSGVVALGGSGVGPCRRPSFPLYLLYRIFSGVSGVYKVIIFYIRLFL